MTGPPFQIIHTKRTILHNGVLKYRKRPVKMYNLEDDPHHSPPEIPVTIIFPEGEGEEGEE